MFGSREVVLAGSAAVATLLVPLALLAQGCERRRVERIAGPPAATAQEPAATGEEKAATAAKEEAGNRGSTSREPRGPEDIGAVEVTDGSFADFTGEGVSLLDCWSPRCPPCRVQGPIVERIAREFAGRVKVGKLNVDSNRRVPTKFGIRYIPTVFIFKDGEEVKRFTGLQGEAILASALEEALKRE